MSNNARVFKESVYFNLQTCFYYMMLSLSFVSGDLCRFISWTTSAKVTESFIHVEKVLRCGRKQTVQHRFLRFSSFCFNMMMERAQH
jgi:hypothetical protein